MKRILRKIEALHLPFFHVPPEEMELEELEAQMEDLKKAMEDEYEANKESTLYLELYETFREAEEAYKAAKKESDEYYDDYNNRPKRCILCGALKGENRDGPCPLARASIAGKN
jgi:rubrerythrin